MIKTAIETPFSQAVRKAYDEKRRLVVPLIGFPGLNITGGTIKLAQQNYGEHFKALKAIADTFNPDLIFPLMDLSVEANALGRYTLFPKGDSATVVKDEFSIDDVVAAERINISFDTRLLGYVETVKLMSIGLPSSIMKGAYVTGPYTLAALLMGAEDAAVATLLNIDELHKVCRFTTKKIMEYTRLLISSGAQLICILEPCGVMLGPDQFEEFSASYVRFLVDTCHSVGVAAVYHICGNTMHLVEKMSETGVDALSLDAPETGVDLPEVAKRISQDVVIIGNISPVASLYRGKPCDVENDVLRLLESMETYPNFILSTGCDLPQEVPVENIQAFMQTGRSYRVR
jgi:uroporphyrinogen decarboxylase